MLVNGTLYNLEAVNTITEKHLKQLEQCDRMLMRNLFQCPVGTPLESFYIETSTQPIRFILQGRRLLYLWTMLQKPSTELARQVFDAQLNNPVKGDWVSVVKKDLSICEIELSMSEIASSSRSCFKSLVSRKMKEQTEKYLRKLQNDHKKTRNLIISEKIQPYLLSEELTSDDKVMLFKLRCEMLDFKGNYPNKYRHSRKGLICELCDDQLSQDLQTHVYMCPIYLSHHELGPQLRDSQYDDIFSHSTQVKAAKLWMQILEFRRLVLE